MRTGNGNELRASHADRDEAVDLVKTAFVQGRLTRDELDSRVGEALAATTCGQLATLTSDIGGASIVADPPPEPAKARTRPSANKVGRSASGAVIAACVAAVATLAAATGAHMRPGPDAVACQSFYVWMQPGVTPGAVMLLDFSVAAANQGPDHALAGDLQALRQAVLQNENPTQVSVAVATVDAACIPYSN